jgi:NADP-dependent alcohol dehydrogenase
VKFISGAVNYNGDPIEILQKRILIKENALPFGTVLTLPATGAK